MMAAGTPDLCVVGIPCITAGDDPYARLTETEQRSYERLPLPRRRREWLAGRHAAKDLVARRHRSSARGTAIENHQQGPERGRPFYRLAGEPGPFFLSIAHSGPVAIAALAQNEGDRVGVDVEQVEYRDAAFEALLLSDSERGSLRALCGIARWRAVTRLWVLKEALLKAGGLGLMVPLTWISVVDPPAGGGANVTTFTVSAGARQKQPRLAHLDRVSVNSATFDINGLIGAWVAVPGWDIA